MRNWALAFVVLLAAYVMLRPKPTPNGAVPAEVEEAEAKAPAGAHLTRTPPPPVRPKSPNTLIKPLPDSRIEAAKASTPLTVTDKAPAPGGKKLILRFKLDEGIAVVQGDIAIGQPTAGVDRGYAEVPMLKLWPTNVIPYYIQPSVRNPDRIREAIAMFDNTVIRLVPLADQTDAIVFEEGESLCKSYAGRMGGKQPLWISAECGPKEIAHEILHALGFVHEQNRSDRDDYISVNFDNIEDQYRDNFEKLPLDFMKLNGQAEFDFESLMMYPAWMFARGGQSTMISKVPDHPIAPGARLSRADVDRLAKVYGKP